MQLMAHFAPVLKQRVNPKDPPFDEVVFPAMIPEYKADFSCLGGFLKPNQLMANYVSKELAKGRLQVPPYAPYIAADVAAAPWPVPTAEHTNALAKWEFGRATAGQAKAARPQPLPLNAWVLYRVRFMFTSDICEAWRSFGGIPAQFNNRSIISHLTSTENIDSSLLYDSLLSARLEETDRARAERSTDAVDFDMLLSAGPTRFKLKAVAQAAKTAPVVDTKKENAPKDTTPVPP